MLCAALLSHWACVPEVYLQLVQWSVAVGAAAVAAVAVVAVVAASLDVQSSQRNPVGAASASSLI